MLVDALVHITGAAISVIGAAWTRIVVGADLVAPTRLTLERVLCLLFDRLSLRATARCVARTLLARAAVVTGCIQAGFVGIFAAL